MYWQLIRKFFLTATSWLKNNPIIWKEYWKLLKKAKYIAHITDGEAFKSYNCFRVENSFELAEIPNDHQFSSLVFFFNVVFVFTSISLGVHSWAQSLQNLLSLVSK